MGLSRQEFMQKMGEDKPVDRLVSQAYVDQANKQYASQTGNDPHGRAWNVSFHASTFMSDDKYCPRKDVYSLMNIPSVEPFKRQAYAVMEAGLACEEMITSRLAKEGYLISAAPWEAKQTGFVDKENWITGNCDGIVAFPGEDELHVLEIKSKYDEVVRNMIAGTVGPDITHVNQLKTYIGFINNRFYTDDNLARLREALVCEICNRLTIPINENVRSCPSCGDVAGKIKRFKPPTKGSIYYMSRDQPSKIKEFIIEIDMEHIEKGIKNTNIAQEHFKNGTLPPRPVGWEGWSKSPCTFCNFKREACRKDDKNGVVDLAQSDAVSFAKSINPAYDYEATKKTVLEYWDE